MVAIVASGSTPKYATRRGSLCRESLSFLVVSVFAKGLGKHILKPTVKKLTYPRIWTLPGVKESTFKLPRHRIVLLPLLCLTEVS